MPALPLSRSLVPAGVLLALLLSGCSHNRWAEGADEVVPVPERYDAEVLAGIATPQAAAAPPASEVCSDVGDGALQGLTARVLEQNLDLRGAWARLRQAEAAAAEAGAPLWPTIDGSLEGSRSSSQFAAGGGLLPGGQPFPGGPTGEQDGEVGGGEATFYRPSLLVSYEIDVWGKLRDRKAAAAALASAEAMRTLEVTLSAQLAETWARLLAERRLVDVLREQIETSERFVELTRLRFGQGQGAAQDIGRQQQQLEALRGQLELALGRERTLVGQLAILAGEPPPSFAPVPGRQLPDLPPLASPGVPLDLIDARPDVRAARLALEAADRRLAAQAKDWLPSLSLSGSVLGFAARIGEIFDDLLWQVAASLQQRAFDGGARAARVRGADARAEERLYAYGQTLLVSLEEVRAALVTNAAQAAFLDSLERQLDEADRVLLLVRDGYREGAATYLDVLTALLSLQELERQRVDAHRQQFANRVQLCRALGHPVAAPAPSITASHTQARSEP